MAALVDDECCDVGKGRHVGELEEGPTPGVCLPADDGKRAEALHRKDVKNHEA